MVPKSQAPHKSTADQTDVCRRAWRAIMEFHGALTPLLDQELREGTEMDLQTYDVLLHTHEAEDEGIRMTELARRLVLSKSGLTAVVDRLEERGWVRRIPDPQDRRATRIMLTEDGESAFHRAAEIHIAGIERHFASHLSEEEAGVIAEALERIGAEATPR